MATNNQITKKGFIKDSSGNILLPITRAELVLDAAGINAFHSEAFIAQLPDASGRFEGLPGLITASEKALLQTLNGEGTGGSGALASIYADLATLFDTSISFNGTALKYYTEKTANTINIKNGEGIAISVANNEAAINLAPLADKTNNTVISNVLTGITVDKYGRVIDVSGSNALGGITLTGAKITEEINALTDNKAVVSKEYVDQQFNTVNTLATGALRFGSVLQDGDLETLWTQRDSWINYYYKLGYAGEIPDGQVLGHNGAQPFKIGDTIIVHHTESDGTLFVYVPSGDEPLTQVGVKDSKGNGYEPEVGNIQLRFNSPFTVNRQTGITYIGLPTLSNENSESVGLISRTDYNNFKLATEKNISYVPNADIVSTAANVYQIGQISGDSGAGSPIYGKDTTYTLGVADGYTSGLAPENDPKLVFTPIVGDATTIQISGGNGISVKHDENNITISAANYVAEGESRNYLQITNGSEFKVVMGAVTEEMEITDGLADFRTVMSYISDIHTKATQYIEISNSLNSTNLDTDTYYFYGSAKLVSAITLDI